MLVCMAPNQSVLSDGEIVKIMLEAPGIDLRKDVDEILYKICKLELNIT